MNKSFILLLFLLALIPLNTYADYNISCTRSCDMYTDPVCSGYSPNTQDTLSSWTIGTPPSSADLYTNKTSWEITPNNEYGAYSNCNFQEYSGGGSFGGSGLGTLNWTHGILNGSNIQPNEYQCTTAVITNDDCANLGGDQRNVWYDVIVYDSTNGSCEGTPTQVYNGSVYGNCQTSFSVTGSNDKAYRYHQYQFADEGTGTCYSTTASLGTGSPTMLNCDVGCNGLAYSFYRSVNITSGTPTGSWVWTLTGNATYDQCDSYGQECLGYTAPTNTSYTTGCSCGEGQNDLGLVCTDDVCVQSCSGNITSLSIVDTTQSDALTSNDPVDYVEFISSDVQGAFVSIVPSANVLLWAVVFVIFLFSMVVLVIGLFK